MAVSVANKYNWYFPESQPQSCSSAFKQKSASAHLMSNNMLKS
jgi:hypothetical protein